MAEAKKKEDMEFSAAELLAADPREADAAREKRNKPMPEEFRDDPSKATGWPVPEDRLPAVMRADDKGSNDYKMATYSEVDDKLRDQELTAGPGAVAREHLTRTINERAAAGKDTNDVQAPPSPAAKAAADGEGAASAPIPVTRRAAPAQSRR